MTFILPLIQQHHHFLNMKQIRKHFQSANALHTCRDLLSKGDRSTELLPLLSPLFCIAVAAASPQCTPLLCGHWQVTLSHQGFLGVPGTWGKENLSRDCLRGTVYLTEDGKTCERLTWKPFNLTRPFFD